MELKDLVEKEKELSTKAFPKFWNFNSEEELLLRLEFLSNAINGEAGELANIIKKLVRDRIYKDKELTIEDRLDHIKEEVVDIVIYAMLFSILLNFDLEKEILKKIEINRKRFLQ